MGLTYKNVLVAVDGSKEAEWAFKKAIEVCKRNQADLVISHIIDMKQFATLGAYEYTMAESSENYAKRLINDYKNQAIEAGVNHVAIDIEYGSPKVKIAKDIAPKHNIDLIICGATGLNAVERFLMGSVSEHITRYAKCDVLVVRTQKDTE
ncbi:universal stress protein [Ferdinandcohnia quinoae]|uniref:Universal stress protein n=1 Tax=Fredinandcohnia quinoae TaxID=2918902 RepID=A0AAW5E3U5_9BACI|nr:universal stress protein [Fredinandcohnia sp. SECRCQ15]MCH1627601.1 universal stress protein [Fredinandcohnia sp. SECRCQ15]